MQATSTLDTDPLTGTIRRMIRVLGAQHAHVSDPGSLQSIARLLFSRLERAKVPARWIEGEHGTPLIVAGSGPIALCTYLDDIHPDAISKTGQPPGINLESVTGNGIERKAAVVSHAAALLANPEWSQQVTMFIETDRHAGSHTIESFLRSEAPVFTSVAWEVADLPLFAPAIIRAATGTLIVRVALRATRRFVEPVYGTVLPDIGIALARFVTSLKSSDDEVHLDGFYDGIETLEEIEFDAVVKMGPGVSRWLTRVAGDERELSTSHMTLGMFCAPSLIVRDLVMGADGDYLPNEASAVIEFQLLPGQDTSLILEALRTRMSGHLIDGLVSVLLERQPVSVSTDLNIPDGYPSLPVAPGPSPAALFATLGIPGTGYTVVSRATQPETSGVSIESIADGAQFLYDLSTSLGSPATAAV
jgi:hypothetical protein